jgi:predicted phosphodiesterase
MRYAEVELGVLHGDALTYESDLLALKYTQKLHGADLAVATAVHRFP